MISSKPGLGRPYGQPTRAGRTLAALLASQAIKKPNLGFTNVEATMELGPAKVCQCHVETLSKPVLWEQDVVTVHCLIAAIRSRHVLSCNVDCCVERPICAVTTCGKSIVQTRKSSGSTGFTSPEQGIVRVNSSALATNFGTVEEVYHLPRCTFFSVGPFPGSRTVRETFFAHFPNSRSGIKTVSPSRRRRSKRRNNEYT